MEANKLKKVWTREDIMLLLERKDVFVGKCLAQLLMRQTADEASIGITRERNSQGFNMVDAQILTDFAKFWLQRGYLSPKQLEIARKKLKKYVGQLTEIAND